MAGISLSEMRLLERGKVLQQSLLDSSVNRKVGNTSFEEKSAKAFSNSKLDITTEILKDSVWGPKQIEERQKKMAKMACQIWRLNY